MPFYSELFAVYAGGYSEVRAFEGWLYGDLAYNAVPSLLQRRVGPGKMRRIA
jgi:hypothetical protein